MVFAASCLIISEKFAPIGARGGPRAPDFLLQSIEELLLRVSVQKSLLVKPGWGLGVKGGTQLAVGVKWVETLTGIVIWKILKHS